MITVIIVLSLSGCASMFFLILTAIGDDRADKDEIIDFVTLNEESLREAIENDDYYEFENQGFIKEIDADETVVDFYCGGAGMGPATAYVGFYYSQDNDMTAIWCAPPPNSILDSLGKGYEWMEPNGDNQYYVEQICDNFFYYEAYY